jgi:HSP20 family protein
MTLVKYRPNREMDQLVPRTFSQFLDSVFDDMVTGSRPVEGNFLPGVDVRETDKAYEIEVMLPGIKKEDIIIDLDDRTLTIRGERKTSKEEDKVKYHLVETSYGTFSRSLTLPTNINRESIQASYTDGVLRVTIDKIENAVTKQIQIK